MLPAGNEPAMAGSTGAGWRETGAGSSLLLPALPARGQTGPGDPLRGEELRRLERAVAAAIAAGRCPGALVLAGRGEKLLYK